jgi:CHAT domain-containing protein
MSQDIQQAVRRVLARDDLLTMAAAADQAVDIVRSRQQVARDGEPGQTLFDIALNRHLRLATGPERHESPMMRSQAWDYAAVLLRFCEMVDARPTCDCTPEELHERALAEQEDHESGLGLDRDMFTGAFNRLHAARNLRLNREYEAALELANLSFTDLWGSGAEPRTAHYVFEVGATYIQDGRSAEIRGQLAEAERYFETNARASGHPTRYRVDFIRALAQWDADPGSEDGYQRLEIAIDRLRDAEKGTDDARADSVRELSLLLAAAEYLAAGQPSDEQVAQALRLGEEALRIADTVRARWRVLARSRAPLARVFERIYGDIALLAHSLSGPGAATLGFRVAVSAKQTGFAARIRDGRTFNNNKHINNLLDQIVEIEGAPPEACRDGSVSREEYLGRLRKTLKEDVSPMLEDTVFPTPPDPADVVKRIGPRYALDFVELRGTLDDTPYLFSTLIEPGGRMWFDLCEPQAQFRSFLKAGRLPGDLARGIERAGRGERAARDVGAEDAAEPEIDWRELAKAVLPERLTGGVLADPEIPPRLLISAHSWLSVVPWALLEIADGVRLVERAIISQTPILTCLSEDPPPSVEGRALIRLVGKDERGVNIALERQAWDFESGTAGVPPHGCDLVEGGRPHPYPGRFDAALKERGAWQFVHVASHGGGKGFDQYLDMAGTIAERAAVKEPQHGQQLSAAGALALKWPTSVLMASCHVGQVINDNGAEPLNFVMALLTGGARCVVAGIDRIDDDGTGRVASHIVSAIRSGRVTLEVALRNAQLAAIVDGTPQSGWALLSAYVR